jgi:hypothetical protein
MHELSLQRGFISCQRMITKNLKQRIYFILIYNMVILYRDQFLIVLTAKSNCIIYQSTQSILRSILKNREANMLLLLIAY